MRASGHDPSLAFAPIVRLTEGPPGLASSTLTVAPHILLVVDGFPKTLGGGERIVLRLASLLPHYGFRASILTFALHPESEFKPQNAPCPLYVLPLTKTYDRAALRGAFALRRLIRGERVQIVQTFFESSDLWAGLVTRALSSARLVWSRRDMGILRAGKHTAAYRAMRRLPHAVFAVSEQVRQHAISVDRIDTGRVHTIYNGLDLPPLGRPPGFRSSDASDVSSSKLENGDEREFTIATVGNIRRVKGHDLLIKAAAQVRRTFPNAHFTIAGEVLEPDYFAELETLVTSLHLAGHVRFVGKISDLAAHLGGSDVFVLPSRSEGFSNALVEAMASGLPVVATAVGGNAEAIEHGQSGLIVAPEDAVALGNALCSLLASPELAAKLGTAARDAVVRSFTTEAMMRGSVAIYQGLLAGG